MNSVNKAIDYLNKVFFRRMRDARRRAKSKKLPFTLTYSFVRGLFFRQGGLCYYTGKKFHLKGLKSMSLDRVDSSLGYIPGNVVWCRLEVNFLKGSSCYAYSRKLCKQFLKGSPDVSVLTYRDS